MLMTPQTSKPRIAALVLAAGKSTRFGSTKMIAPVDGRPMVQHALFTAQEVCKGSVNLVVGHDRSAIVNAAAGLADKTVVNESFAQGIGTSIAAGVRACRNHSDAILILLGDQALITGDHLLHLIDAWSGVDTDIVASAFDDVRGPPILFPSKCFDDLVKLEGDDGAKIVMENTKYQLRTVACEAAKFDVDQKSDLHQLEKT
jgi:molybdenum cofactor cytidylyltransferase